MLDRMVGRRIRTRGANSILRDVKHQTAAANITFGNLECPLSNTGPHSPDSCVFRADPKAVAVLLDGGFDVVSLANNHTYDAGKNGLLNTFGHLDNSGISYTGAGRSPSAACEPAMFEINGLDVGFAAFTDLPFDYRGQCKIDGRLQTVTENITTLSNRFDLLFVSVHWGHEYHNSPSPRQKKVAHALIDAGADCILGHHPHVLQGIEVYKGRPVLYSMGNFVFDQRKGERMESAIFDIWHVHPHLWHIKATPVWINRERMGPEYPSPARAKTIARRLKRLSDGPGTKASIKGNRAIVRITPVRSKTVHPATDRPH